MKTMRQIQHCMFQNVLFGEKMNTTKQEILNLTEMLKDSDRLILNSSSVNTKHVMWFEMRQEF